MPFDLSAMILSGRRAAQSRAQQHFFFGGGGELLNISVPLAGSSVGLWTNGKINALHLIFLNSIHHDRRVNSGDVSVSLFVRPELSFPDDRHSEIFETAKHPKCALQSCSSIQ